MDRLFRFLIFFPIVIASFLAGWWGSYLFVSHEAISIFAFVSFAIGIFLALWASKLVPDIYRLPIIPLALIVLLYNFFFFGFFMGVPIFNVIIGAFVGYYVGTKAKRLKGVASDFKRISRRAGIFTGVIMSLVCIASAVIALADPYTPANLSGMLRANISWQVVYAIIISGGIALATVEYFLTSLVARIAYNRKNYDE